ncbi:MAG: hypothetical protein AABX76_00555 [Nanoarchaeota archaeon]
MILENELVKLGTLEVGGVERVIGDIEGERTLKNEICGRFEEEVSAYNYILSQKLDKMVDNILLLGPYITEISKTHNYSSPTGRSERADYHSQFTIKKPFGFLSNYSFFVDHNWHSYYGKNNPQGALEYVGNFSFRFDFNGDGGLKRIIFSENHSPWYGKKKHDRIKSKNPADFVSRLIRLNERRLMEMEEPLGNGLTMPIILNGVPDFVNKAYFDLKDWANGDSIRIDSLSKETNNLKVIDF